MTKKEITNLIDTDIDKAFEILDTIFEMKGPYKRLSEEWYKRPNNFEEDDYRSRLRRFVQVECDVDTPTNITLNDDIYTHLCKLNFEHETKYFQSMLEAGDRPFLNFVIRSEQEQFGQKWLVGKLIQYYQGLGKSLGSVENIEFTLKENNLEFLLEKLTEILRIDFNTANMEPLKKKSKICNSLVKKLNTESQIFIIKNAYNFVHSDEFSDFIKIWTYLHEELRDNELEHKCIFFFLEEKTNTRYICQEYCIDTKQTKVFNARLDKEFKFIDMCIDNLICEQTLEDWVSSCNDAIIQKFKDIVADSNKAKQFLKDGNPISVIHAICNHLEHHDFLNKTQWL